jgi:hypothetical protein
VGRASRGDDWDILGRRHQPIACELARRRWAPRRAQSKAAEFSKERFAPTIELSAGELPGTATGAELAPQLPKRLG